MKRAIMFQLILSVVLGTPLAVQAQTDLKNPSQANIRCDRPVEAACEQVRLGVKAFRSKNYPDAVNHFRNAADLDPGYVNAKLYLGSALLQEYVPGQESPENLRIANQAQEAFEAVLKLDPKQSIALASIANICYNLKQFDKARQYQLRLIAVDPTKPEPYYWVGVLDWVVCFPRTQQMRKDLNLNVPLDLSAGIMPPLPEEARVRLASENGAAVEEGLQNLKKAIELKPDDINSMAYLNLLYRQKADLEASADARQEDLRLADEWVKKSLELARRQNPPAAQQQNPPQ